MSGRDYVRQWLPDQFEPLLSAAKFGQFLSVGVLGAVADTTVLAVASMLFGLSDIWAKAAGIEVAIVVMFIANERWTFTDQGKSGPVAFLARLGRSHLVRVGGVSVQIAVFWALIRPYRISVEVAGLDLWIIIASLLAIIAATSINYIFESLFTWQVQMTDSPQSTGIESDD